MGREEGEGLMRDDLAHEHRHIATRAGSNYVIVIESDFPYVAVIVIVIEYLL